MKIGILREEKKPFDRRVIFTPKQCFEIKKKYPGVEILVRSSNHRCFSDNEYKEFNIPVVEDLNECDILLGIKEVPLDSLIANKTYFYFFAYY